MRKLLLIIIILLIGIGLFAQISTQRVVNVRITSASAVGVSPADTFNVVATVKTDQLGQGYNGSQIDTADILVDQLGRQFEVYSITTQAPGSITFRVFELQAAHIAPFGNGVVQAPTNGGTRLIVPDNDNGITSALYARIINHSILTGESNLADTSAALRALIAGIAPPAVTTTTIYCPSHGLDTADYVGSVFGLQATCDLADASDADNLQTRYVVGIPHADSLEIQISGLVYRPSNGLDEGEVYYLQDNGDNATTPGTVTSKTFVVLDSNYIHLIDPSSLSEASTFVPVVYIPPPAFAVYGTDQRMPHDTAVQNIAEVYAAAGAIVPNSLLVAAGAVISDNDTYKRNNVDNSGTGAHVWHWNGQYVTRITQLQVSLSLTDTLYGGSGILELDTVSYTGDYPDTDDVIDYVEQNYTSNGLRLVNGSLLYFVGGGTEANPDWIWQIIDDVSANRDGPTKWDRIVKLIKQPAQELAADNVTFTPAGTISATDVQAAIVEALTDANAYTDALGLSDLADHTANQDILLDGNTLSDDGTGGLSFDGGQAYLTPNTNSLNSEATALTISHSSGGSSEVLRLVETTIPSLKLMTFQQAEEQWASIISDAGATISYQETSGLTLSTVDAEPVNIATDGTTRLSIDATGDVNASGYTSSRAFSSSWRGLVVVDNSGNFEIADTTGLFGGGSGSGSTETADGVTILGDGTGGDPFRVDTALVATTQAVIDSIAALSGGSGDVTGPGSSTDNAIARFDGTTGKLIQNSAVTISDAGAMTMNGGNIALNGGWLSGDGGNEGIFVSSAGNVAIGNTNAFVRLHVEGGDMYLFDNGGDARLLFGDNTTSGQYGGFQWNSASDYLKISGSGAAGVLNNLIVTGDALGINFSSGAPAKTIDVNGDAQIRGGTIGLDATSAVKIKTGSGSPESVVSASPGSLFLGTGGTYTKDAGTGSTGWEQLAQIATAGTAGKIAVWTDNESLEPGALDASAITWLKPELESGNVTVTTDNSFSVIDETSEAVTTSISAGLVAIDDADNESTAELNHNSLYINNVGDDKTATYDFNGISLANASTETIDISVFAIDAPNLNDINLGGILNYDLTNETQIFLNTAKTLGIFHGSGSPESVVSAAVGSVYHRTDGGAGTSFYVKESGTGSTGWVAK